VAGQVVFRANCAACHTLADAGTTGNVGPNLDSIGPDAALVEATVTAGRGVMPAFGERLTPEEIKAVAEYVASVAGG
jgi:mono/diheme cytochrome c family protein